MKRPFAILTLARNEPVFLRMWCNYYCPMLGPENVHVLDNQTSDGSVEDARRRWPGLQVRAVDNRSPMDVPWVTRTVVEFQRELLALYDVVCFADPDEFLLTWSPIGLASYLEGFRRSGAPFVRSTGWHVIQQLRRGEAALELREGQSVLHDRHSMWRLPLYDKAQVVSEPQSYTTGFHPRKDDGAPDRELVCLHAWMLDLDVFSGRHAAQGRAFGMEPRQAFLHRKVGPFASSGPETPIPPHWRPLLVW